MSTTTQTSALQDIIVSATKGVEAKRWVSSYSVQPKTVELWVRIFKAHMQHNLVTPDKWALERKDFINITRECLTSTDTVVLDCIVPHPKALHDFAPDNIPTLTQCFHVGPDGRSRG